MGAMKLNHWPHLILLGVNTFLLVSKTFYFRGSYDTWAPKGRGRDVKNTTDPMTWYALDS